MFHGKKGLTSTKACIVYYNFSFDQIESNIWYTYVYVYTMYYSRT